VSALSIEFRDDAGPTSFDEHDFIPSSEPDDCIHPDEYARVCRNRDKYLRELCICVADMEEAGRALFSLLTHFRDQMDASARAQMLDVHANLIYPDARCVEDMARIIEDVNARALVDIADADSGEVLFEHMALGFVFPDNRAEHARILGDIGVDGFSIIGGDDGPVRRLTLSPIAGVR
jgi:hypothetical protein